jgi:hypothetical protein
VSKIRSSVGTHKLGEWIGTSGGPRCVVAGPRHVTADIYEYDVKP